MDELREAYRVAIDAASDVGCRRPINEDNVRSVVPGDAAVLGRKGVLMIVADGMGGHSAGEVASRLAVEVVHRAYYDSPDAPVVALRQAFEAANQAIYDEASREAEKQGMGTTGTALVIAGPHAHCAHVGDSRLYLVRDDEIYLMTEDHSAVQSMVASGVLRPEEARHHADRNVILRALGTHASVEVSTWERPLPIRLRDRFVLCSDGLHDLVEEDEICRVVASEQGAAACEHLIALAKERGGYDNITVIVAVVEPASVQGRPRETRDLGVAR